MTRARHGIQLVVPLRVFSINRRFVTPTNSMPACFVGSSGSPRGYRSYSRGDMVIRIHDGPKKHIIPLCSTNTFDSDCC